MRRATSIGQTWIAVSVERWEWGLEWHSGTFRARAQGAAVDAGVALERARCTPMHPRARVSGNLKDCRRVPRARRCGASARSYMLYLYGVSVSVETSPMKTNFEHTVL